MARARIALSCLALIAASGAASLALAQSAKQATEWSQWRGPGHDGAFPEETSWRTDWDVRPPRTLWKVAVGVGYSGVAISAGRAYTVGNADGQDTVFCLDAATGDAVWTKSYPQALVDIYNPGGPNAPPVIDGDWLYIVSKQGLVSCFAKADGALRWRIDLVAQAGAKMPMWGFASAPLIVGERLFLNANRSGVALNKETGQVAWSSSPDECGYASVVATSFRGAPALAVLGNRELFVVRQDNGEPVWQTPWATNMGENSADPLAVGESLYVSSWWDMGAALFRPAEGTEPVWRNLDFQNHIAAPAAWDGYLYGSHGPVHRRTQNVAIACVELATGRTAWSEPGLRGSVIVAGGKLLILTRDGELIAAEATPAGYRELARVSGLGVRTWTPPTLHDGRLYVRDADGFVLCLDLR
jgi:outer membrane protein assembly factor BamB